ncbi:MAG: hypothetical protein PUP93_04285 [Rhizonema sp. NSF051]|nr:hypothetical protein [Rhizonema sp. NSF051]
MKSFVRWGTTLGLVGSTLLATVFSGNAPVLALSEQQIKEKLDSVPVFLITNPQGLPLSRPLQAQNGQKASGSVTGVYMSHQEAEGFINQLRNLKDKDPKLTELVKSLQVTAVPLGVIYQQLKQTKSQPNHLEFAFKPLDKEMQAALQLLRASGKQVQQFRSVPVFTVKFGADKGYVSIKAGNQKQEIIPLFLSQQDAQGLLTQVKQKFPNAVMDVVDMDGVIKVFQEKNDPWLNQVVLVPTQEDRDYIRKLPKNPATPATPAPKK